MKKAPHFIIPYKEIILNMLSIIKLLPKVMKANNEVD